MRFLSLCVALQVGLAGAAAAQTETRVLRSEVGASGSQKAGTFVLDSPQESFTPGVDQQVVVYFEWEGAPGPRKCEIAWMAPDGSIALRGQVDLQVKGKKFGSHFTLLMPATMAPGLWAAEAKVDGQPAGVRTFRVLKGSQPTRLSPEQLYKLGLDATLILEAVVPPGAEPRRFSGFVLFDHTVITSFQGVEGATAVRVTFPDGSVTEATDLISFSRDFDWALLKVEVPASHKRLAIAMDYKVGDHFNYIQWNDEQRVVSGGSVVGRDQTKAVPRVVLSDRPSPRAIGSPLMNETGEAFAMTGVRADTMVSMYDQTTSSGGPRWSYSNTSLAVPLGEFNVPSGDAKPLAGFAPGFRKPITRANLGGYVLLLKGLAQPSGRGGVPSLDGEFAKSDGGLSALVQWQSPTPLTGNLSYVLYGRDERPIVQAPPVKLALKPGQRMDSSSPVSFADLRPGDYRIDLLWNDEVAARTYFRLKP